MWRCYSAPRMIIFHASIGKGVDLYSVKNMVLVSLTSQQLKMAIISTLIPLNSGSAANSTSEDPSRVYG